VPTIISVIAAIQDYEKRGGTASVFINDDGMQAIEPELAEARKKYYRENNIGYCARLPNMKTKKARSWFSKSAGTGQDGEGKNIPPPQSLANQIGFERKGKFKKASNMNYCLDFSNRVEDEMVRLSGLRCDERGCTEEDLTVEDDDELYEEALGNVLRADEGRTCEFPMIW
jgi:hypothetical protein